MKYRLGLDLGTNSLGWAAVEVDEDGRPNGVLDMGVRVFSDGRNPKDGSSLAVQRRVPRGQRRRRDRYLLRRRDLMDTLIACGLMPDDESEQKALERLDPYELRARALDARLSPHELGRALFHLAQRRGFKSNRKSDGADDPDAKKAREDINRLYRRMKESGARTLGEFQARRHRDQRTVRARVGHGLYPDRAMYESEFDVIRATQESYQTLRPDQWDTVRGIIFRQRPLKPVEPGWCLLEPGEKRAERALPIAQEFRMVQEVNNIRVRTNSCLEMRPLTPEERPKLLARLRTQKEVTFAKLPGIVGLPVDTRINLNQWNRKGLKGDETSAVLSARNIFGKPWHAMPLEERTEIVRVLLNEDDPASVRRIAMEQWGLDEQAATRAASARLPQGHVHLSAKALDNLAPLMEREGYVWSEAITAQPDYAHHSDFRPDTALDCLPYYGEVLPQQVVGADPNAPEGDAPAKFGRIANPTVHIGLNQLRRVVNRLIEVHGKPEHIVVELARDLKMNREQRREAERAQREGALRNERFRKMLEDAEKPVTADALRRLRLWEEQGPPNGRFCPYTGETISFEMAISATTEIDHILPMSKTLDDSPANQVLCVTRANRDKGDHSPYEAFGHSPAEYDYEAIKQRAEVIGDTLRQQNKRDSKSWRFFEDALERYADEGEFLVRQLNETKHLSRVARRYLAHLFDEKNQKRQFVDATPGRLTAAIRKGWGLNSLLFEARNQDGDAPDAKLRDDHRHHAIDAFVVACTDAITVKRLSTAAGQGHEDDSLSELASKSPPWEGFDRGDLRPFIKRLVVSHRPDHGTRSVQGKTTGQLHNDTAYGIVQPGVNGAASKVVVRKSLSTFSNRKHVEVVRDPALKDALIDLWDKVIASGGKPVDFAHRAWDEGVQLKGRVQRIRRARVLEDLRVIPIRDKYGNVFKAYKPDSNEFADVWRLPTGKWQAVVIRKFDANQPDFDPSTYRPHPAAKRLLRLHINDLAAMDSGADQFIARICKITVESGREQIYLAPHNEANVDARNRKKEDGFTYIKKSAEGLRRLNFRKVGVDEIGRVLDPGPPK